jgi:hypothetical protein
VTAVASADVTAATAVTAAVTAAATAGIAVAPVGVAAAVAVVDVPIVVNTVHTTGPHQQLRNGTYMPCTLVALFSSVVFHPACHVLCSILFL